MKIDVKILDPRAWRIRCPPRHAGSAGLDLRACLDAAAGRWPQRLAAGAHRHRHHLADPGYAALILPRSGLGHKHGIVLGNLVGLIDSDYQGQLMVSAWNRSDVAARGSADGSASAQLVIVVLVQAQFNVVNDFPEPAWRGWLQFYRQNLSRFCTSRPVPRAARRRTTAQHAIA